jgi:hypothetical protein
MHEIVVKFTVGIVPELVIGIDYRLVIVEDLEVFCINRLSDAIKRAARPFFYALSRIGIQRYPNHPTMLHIAVKLLETVCVKTITGWPVYRRTQKGFNKITTINGNDILMGYLTSSKITFVGHLACVANRNPNLCKDLLDFLLINAVIVVTLA